MNPEVLSKLQREVIDLRAEMTALRAAPATKRTPHRRSRRFLAAFLAAALLLTIPLGLFAANFQDLNPGSPHNANINLIADVGITKGCYDAAHYCPNDYVTREQMASFLARTAGLGNNPPVVNAATAQTVPDGSVTAAKLNTTGAQTGQVLTATANGVAWQAVAGGNGQAGPAGPQGPAGPAGAQGPQGPAGVAYTHTIIVNSGNDPQKNGEVLLQALDEITTASASDRFLVKIEPGIYDLHTDVLAMKSFVDIEGSGEVATQIIGYGKAAANTGTIVAAQNAELRFLTVHTIQGKGTVAVGLFSSNTNIKIRNVTFYTEATTNGYGILLSGGGAEIRDVHINIESSGVGIAATAGTHLVAGAIIDSGQVGIYVYSSATMLVFDSIVGGGTQALLTQAGGATRVAHTLVDGSVSGQASCVGAFDQQFVALDVSCK